MGKSAQFVLFSSGWRLAQRQEALACAATLMLLTRSTEIAPLTLPCPFPSFSYKKEAF